MTSVSLPQVPANPASNVASTPAALQLLPGQVIDALVLKLVNAETLRLQIPGGTIDVKSDVPLTPGARVALSVQGTLAQPTFVVRSAASPAYAIAPQASDPAILSDKSSATASVLQSAATILRDAASRQSGLASLYADIEAVLAQTASTAPQPVVTAIRQLLAMRLDVQPNTGVDADDVKAALVRSGLPGSLRAANGPAPGSSDLRTALSFLRQALKAWIDSQPLAKESAGLPLPKSAEPNPIARAAGPMPPYRNASTVPQAPVTSSISVSTSPRDLALHLLDETEGALARETLLQIASLPDDMPAQTARTSANSDRMTFDIPLATAQGTAIAQIRIERDGPQQGRPETERTWRASFSIDLEPIGPVHVRIAMAGERTMVSMNADRAESAHRLSEELPLLEAGLRRAELEPGELVCHSGTPRAVPTAPGQFMDHAT